MGALRLFEVSLRDGLQNESEFVPTSTKLKLLHELVAAGCRDIEVASFVRPRWIPQLADAADVVRGLPEADGVRFWALVPNKVGLERAMDAGIQNFGTFLSASETHNKKNLNRTVRESLAGAEQLIEIGTSHQMTVRSYISTVFGCPYEGQVGITRTVELAQTLLAAGASEVVLGDTTGMANPEQVRTVLQALIDSGVPIGSVAAHFHDTRGTALANTYAAWQMGVRTFDGSVAGIGGCPYAPGAAGNVATEDLVNLFESMGEQTGVQLEALCAAGIFMSEVLGRTLPGRFHQYWLSNSKVSDVRSA
jgi:hydroxymethylglutaryl-CoA lyase